MTNLATLRDIAARLEQATGPDRELDAIIHCAITPGRITHPYLDLGWTIIDSGSRRVNCGRAQAPYITKDRGPSPQYTQSLDAIAALHERLLPGAMWKLGSGRTGNTVCLPWAEISGPGDWFIQVSAPTPVLAWLRAIVAVLIAQAESHDGAA